MPQYSFCFQRGERVVVALGTLELDAEEVLPHRVGQLVDRAVRQEVGDGRVVLDRARGGHEVGDEVVPGIVLVERLLEPLVEGFLEDEPVRESVGKSLAVQMSAMRRP